MNAYPSDPREIKSVPNHIQMLSVHALQPTITKKQTSYITSTFQRTNAWKFRAILYYTRACLQSDIVVWNAVINGHIINHQYSTSLSVFNELITQRHIPPNITTFIIILKACAAMGSIKNGLEIHQWLSLPSNANILNNIQVQNSLMNMYGKCNDIQTAKRLYKKLKQNNVHDIMSYGVMMSLYLNDNQSDKAIQLFDELMRKKKNKPNATIFLNALKACAQLKDLAKGKQIHRLLMNEYRNLFDETITVQNALISMFGKCGAMDLAYTVWRGMKHQDIVTLNGIMTSYIENNEHQTALDLYHKYQNTFEYTSVTFICGLKAAVKLKSLSCGEMIHQDIVQYSKWVMSERVQVHSLLMDLYGKCGEIGKALEIYDRYYTAGGGTEIDLINCLMNVLIENGEHELALNVFDECVDKDVISYNIAIKACCAMMSLEKGKEIHAWIANNDSNVLCNAELRNNLLHFYGKCGDLDTAESIWCSISDEG
eukprot:617363_1